MLCVRGRSINSQCFADDSQFKAHAEKEQKLETVVESLGKTCT